MHRFFARIPTSPLLFICELAAGMGFLAATDFSRFDRLNRTAELYPIERGGLYGFIDNSGRQVVEPRFRRAQEFHDGRGLIVSVEGKTGYVDSAGNLAIPALYESGGDFSENLAAVRLNGKWGFVDRNGQVVIQSTFEAVGQFNLGLAPVKVHGLYGYCDTKGKLVIEPKYTWALGFSQDRAAVYLNKKAGFIDKGGKVVTPMSYDDTGDFSEGLAHVYIGERLMGYLDRRGNWAINPQFESGWYFQDGNAAVSRGGKFGFVRRDLTTLVPFQFDTAAPFHGALARVTLNSKHAFVNRRGKVVWKQQ